MSIVMLAGPIKAWWGAPREGTVQHTRYLKWRDDLSKVCVNHGHLVYRPHEAFKGAWDEKAQVVNDAMLRLSDVVFNLTPLLPNGEPAVPSEGTDLEMELAAERGTRVVAVPPPTPEEAPSMTGTAWRKALLAAMTHIGASEEGVAQMKKTFDELEDTSARVLT